jgi:hypothetical protein
MRKVKIEICDANGEQVTVAMSGQVTKERLMQILTVFEDINNADNKHNQQQAIIKTAKDKMLDVIKTNLGKIWFTSKDLSLLYMDRYHEPVKSSTISTYLTRLYSNGYLERKGNRSCWQYRVVMPISTKNVDVKDLVKDLQKE